MGKGVSFSTVDGSNVRVGVVTARWNSHITESLEEGVREGLMCCGVQDAQVTAIEVAGSFELLAGAKYLIDTEDIDVVVCLGVLINGETDHYEYIASGVSNGIAMLNTSQSIPVIFGVLTCQTEEQAIARSSGEHNHGVAWGKTAVEMALLRK